MNRKKAPDSPKQAASQHRKEVVLKATLFTLVCLWMFVLGILVGRGTAPVRFNIERLQDKLAGLKAATVDKTTRRYRVAFQKLDKEMDLGFHETLKKENTEVPAGAKARARDTARSNTGTPAAAGAPGGKHASQAPQTTKVPADQKPSKAAPPHDWFIQVASTQDKVQGNRLAAHLRQEGYSVQLAVVVLPGKGTWYRVRVGGYPSRVAADFDLKRLKKDRFSPMIISP